MPELFLHAHEPREDGCLVRVTPESAGWSHVGFEVCLVGEVRRRLTDRETCVVVVEGSVDFYAGGQEWHGVGRASPFDGPPVALYVPPGVEWSASGQAELGICTAPAAVGCELRLLASPRLEARGSGSEARAVAHILMEDEPAEALLVTEVVTPPGHWSSFPPHKHDVDDPPRETALEETYYHRVRPADGFGFQRVYTDDKSLDEAFAVCDRDVVLVPRGYHPVTAGARHELYYLNVMAGPVRAWNVTVAPAFG